MPKALKSCPKSKISPNLVTLVPLLNNEKCFWYFTSFLPPLNLILHCSGAELQANGGNRAPKYQYWEVSICGGAFTYKYSCTGSESKRKVQAQEEGIWRPGTITGWFSLKVLPLKCFQMKPIRLVEGILCTQRRKEEHDNFVIFSFFIGSLLAGVSIEKLTKSCHKVAKYYLGQLKLH